MTRSDYVDWKRSDITQAFLREVEVRYEVILDELTKADTWELARYKQGYIQACADVLELDFDFQEESDIEF